MEQEFRIHLPLWKMETLANWYSETKLNNERWTLRRPFVQYQKCILKQLTIKKVYVEVVRLQGFEIFHPGI
jgi:hypothetical protein